MYGTAFAPYRVGCDRPNLPEWQVLSPRRLSVVDYYPAGSNVKGGEPKDATNGVYSFCQNAITCPLVPGPRGRPDLRPDPAGTGPGN